MASFYSSWVGGDDWRIRLDVSEDADETGCTYACGLYWDNTYASPSGLSSSWSITVAGDRESGTITLSGSSDRKIASFTKRVSKGTAKKTVSFAATFKITGSSVSAYRTGAKLSGSRSLAAKESYTVRYSANGGTGAPSSQTKWHGTALKLSTSKPARTGHRFQGWAKTASGSVAYDPGDSYTANASVTLYAVWKANTYEVSYSANGGTGAPAAQTKTYGKALTLSKTVPSRDNHDFLGWGTSASSTTAAYGPGDSYTRNAAATLYAVWRLAHVPPEITGLRVDRCAPDGTVSDEGDSALVEFAWTVEDSVASVAIEHRRSGTAEWERADVQASGQSGSVRQVVGAGALSGDHAWEFRVTVADANLSTSATRTVASMFYAIDVRAGGRGLAFGRPANADGLSVAMDARFERGLEAAELSWPVGGMRGLVWREIWSGSYTCGSEATAKVPDLPLYNAIAVRFSGRGALSVCFKSALRGGSSIFYGTNIYTGQDQSSHTSYATSVQFEGDTVTGIAATSQTVSGRKDGTYTKGGTVTAIYGIL